MLRVFEFGRSSACEAVVMLDVQIPVEIDVDLEDCEVQQSLLLLGCRVLAASYVSVHEDEDGVLPQVRLIRTRIRALDSSMWGVHADAVTAADYASFRNRGRGDDDASYRMRPRLDRTELWVRTCRLGLMVSFVHLDTNAWCFKPMTNPQSKHANAP